MPDHAPCGTAAAELARVLVADDQPDIIAALRLALKAAGFDAASAASIEEITRQVDTSEFDLLLMDLNYARDTTSAPKASRSSARCTAGTRTCRSSR